MLARRNIGGCSIVIVQTVRFINEVGIDERHGRQRSRHRAGEESLHRIVSVNDVVVVVSSVTLEQAQKTIAVFFARGCSNNHPRPSTKKPGAEAPGDRVIPTRCTYKLPSPSSLCCRLCLTRELETRRPSLAPDPGNGRVA